MADLFYVPAGERETVRIFACDLADRSADDLRGDAHRLSELFGTSVDPAHLDLIKASDLDGLGLSQFLIDGYGIAEADIEPERNALDQQGPWLLLLRSRAFAARPVELRVASLLTPVAVFSQAQPELATPTAPMAADTALGSEKIPQEPLHRRRGSLGPVLILLALAGLILTVLVLPKL